MKNSSYIIAGMLIIIWAIVLIGFESFTIYSVKAVHFLLFLAFIIILFNVLFKKTTPSQNSKAGQS